MFGYLIELSPIVNPLFVYFPVNQYNTLTMTNFL